MARLVFLAVLALTGFMMVVLGTARAHQSPTGWNYPLRCCWSPNAAPSGRPGDCDEIPTEAVKAGEGGYHVTLVPGDHPMVKKPLSFVVPYDDAETSFDGLYHICFKADMTPRCFFAGAQGS